MTDNKMAMATPTLGHVFPCLLYACAPFCKQKWKTWLQNYYVRKVYNCESNL